MSRLLVVATLVFVVNLPFGFWRAGVRRLSVPWFVAVHTPVPLVILVRWASGLGFQLATFPVLVSAFFAGQFVGGRVRGMGRPKPTSLTDERVTGDNVARLRGSRTGTE